jgi:hypothetical protein
VRFEVDKTRNPVACIGTQPLGSVWIGFLASRVGAMLATGLNAAPAVIIPVGLRLLGVSVLDRRRPA